MNYPVWYLPELGGGAIIAVIAVFHVFISHFAVGGGLYLVMAEKKALRELSEPIMEFTRAHARFFLLVTMVLGSISGVGIWFAIGLVNPAATSYLIHNFVFGWAAEWVFFMVEIAAAFVYFYTFGTMEARSHIRVGYLYFFAAWVSLFLINGIIGAMLTPGQWAETNDFWQGLFNPSFWPSLIFRTFVAILLAGCYGYLSAARSPDNEVRESMTRFSGLWSLIALVGAVPSAVWYLQVLPDGAQNLVLGKSPTITQALLYGSVAVLIFLFITLVVAIARPRMNNRPVAMVALCCSFLMLGAFEWTREAARRPYVLNELIYSNSIPKAALEQTVRDGFLSSALWVKNEELDVDNREEVGRELFIHQCYSCHTIHGVNNDIAGLTANMSYPALTSYIKRIHEVRYFMPPFAGSEQEAAALAAFLVGGVHGGELSGLKPSGGAGGGTVFEEHCSACHAIEDVAAAFADEEQEGIAGKLRRLNEISDEMEPFSGTEHELKLLSSHLYVQNNPEQAAAEPIPTGGALFELHCSVCHVAEDVALATSGWDESEISENLTRLNEISEEMQPFGGSENERQRLAQFIDEMKGGN